jgi:hypothetical protein
MAIAAIVASARVRAGKTLLARLLAENFFLSGARPALLDTDTTEKRLWSFFPVEAQLLDVDRVTDQMTLFETLSVGSANPRVVEVAHRTAKKFFEVMRDADYAKEARAADVEPVIFYIPSPDPDSYEYGRQLHEQLPGCEFVVVQNAYLGEIKHLTRLSVGYRALEILRPRIVLPALDPQFVPIVDDPSFSFREFMREPTTELSPAAREAIRSWLVGCLRTAYAAVEALEHKSALIPSGPGHPV